MKITKILSSAMTLVLLLSLNSCGHDIGQKYEKPTGLIDAKVANAKEELYKAAAYNKIKEVLLQSKVPVEYNRDVWFDLDNLENYIHYVREESEKLGYEDLGLRVYLGAVEEDGLVKTTMFFSPTHATNSDQTRSSGSRSGSSNFNTPGMDCLNYGTAGEPDEYMFN